MTFVCLIGVVWGRGAIDNKHNVIAQLAAVEGFLSAGRKPRRTMVIRACHWPAVSAITVN